MKETASGKLFVILRPVNSESVGDDPFLDCDCDCD